MSISDPDGYETDHHYREFRTRVRWLGLECGAGFRVADLSADATGVPRVRLPSVPWRAFPTPAVPSPERTSVEGVARWENEGGAPG